MSKERGIQLLCDNCGTGEIVGVYTKPTGGFLWLCRACIALRTSVVDADDADTDDDPGPVPLDNGAGEAATDGAIVRAVAETLRSAYLDDRIDKSPALFALFTQHGIGVLDRALRRAANMTDLADAELKRLDASGEPPF